MNIRNILISLIATLTISTNIPAMDCLSYARKLSDSNNIAVAKFGKEMTWFYRITEALYTQYNTNSRSYTAKEIPLYAIKDPIGHKDLVKEFFNENELKEFSEEMLKYNNFMAEQGIDLAEYKNIEAIHQGAIYGKDSPEFCKNFEYAKLLSRSQIIAMIRSADFKKALLEDANFQKVLTLQESLPATDPKFRIGVEIELFSIDYLPLFDKYIDWDKEVNKGVNDIINSDIFIPQDLLYNAILKNIKPTDIFEDITKNLDAHNKTALGMAGITKENYSLNSLKETLRTDFVKALSEKMKWFILGYNLLTLEKQPPPDCKINKIGDYECFARSYFSYAPMSFTNILITSDTSGYQPIFGVQIPKIEIIHERPYNNIAAYLESLFLLTHRMPKLTKQILYPEKLLNNDYTLHMHMSYQGNNLKKLGIIYQDTIALAMLAGKYKEDVFTTNNTYIRFNNSLKDNEKALVTINVEGDNSRIELRRQLPFMSYKDFLIEAYLFLKDPEDGIKILTKRNAILFSTSDPIKQALSSGSSILKVGLMGIQKRIADGP
jgi:hypothetical protein